jgi:hypothetical protein
MIAHAHHDLANLVNMRTMGTPTTDRMSMRLRKSCMVLPFALTILDCPIWIARCVALRPHQRIALGSLMA